jgi:hypothetical protein
MKFVPETRLSVIMNSVIHATPWLGDRSRGKTNPAQSPVKWIAFICATIAAIPGN